MLPRALVAGLNKIFRDVHAKYVRAKRRGRQGGRSIAASKIKDFKALCDAKLLTSASPLSRIVAAMRVKSPFSQRALLGFIDVDSYRPGWAPK